MTGELSPSFGGARSDVGARVDALSAAVDAARGRMDDSVLDPAADLVARAAERLMKELIGRELGF